MPDTSWMLTNLSASTPLESIRNIVFVGGSGVGKSSLINLVTGRHSAVANNNACGVTIEPKYHDWAADMQLFRLWDTPGLSEGSFGNVLPKEAQDILRSLLKKLNREAGVHLVVHCMPGLSRVTKAMKQIYDAIVKIRDEAAPDVPLAAVITNLEQRSASRTSDTVIPSMEEWWINNLPTLSKYNMQFSAHACITTLPDDAHPKLSGRRELCQQLVRRLITQRVLLKSKLVRNVVIAGETGSGKSSLVNLVLGSQQAITVHDLRPAPISTNHYDLGIDNHLIRLWDTPGQLEGLHGSGRQKRAQEALRSLFVNLDKRGGIHLLIICIRGTSYTMTATKRVYNLIAHMRTRFCPETPVVAVITELEGLSAEPDIIASMEEWWRSNPEALSDFTMFSGHACITNLLDDQHPQVPGRRELCQGLVRRLIIQSISLRNVVIAGEAGSGKSSLVNLVFGSEKAISSHDLNHAVTTTSHYDLGIDNQLIRIWDTPGLREGSYGNKAQKRAQEALRSLFVHLSKRGGTHLLIICIGGSSYTLSATKKVCDLIAQMHTRFCPETPVVAVVTELEGLSAEPDVAASMEEWWRSNATLSYFNMFSGHACITNSSDDRHPQVPGRRELCQGLVRRLIVQGVSLRNVVIAGEAGSGKSSVVNLVLGSEKAITSHDLKHPATTTNHYDLGIGDQLIRLWDTPGLWEGLHAGRRQRRAQETLRSLFVDLNKRGGVHLLIFCIRGISNTMTTTKAVYDEIIQIRTKFCPAAPVVTVFTELEDLSVEPDIVASMEEWWKNNIMTLSNFKMLFSGHACVTTLPDDCDTELLSRRALCQELARRLIVKGVSPKLARNVVIAGETGAGKSSLINLVLGSEQAITTDGRPPTIITTHHYDLGIDNQSIRLWDTPEQLEELDGSEPKIRAQEALQSLLMDLGNKKGGVHLLVICIPGISNNMTATKRVYNEIVQMRTRFCPATPVVAVITGLESLSANMPGILASMEKWWEDNLTTLSDLNMSFSAHACVTTMPDGCHPQVPGRREVCQYLVRNFIMNEAL